MQSRLEFLSFCKFSISTYLRFITTQTYSLTGGVSVEPTQQNFLERFGFTNSILNQIQNQKYYPLGVLANQKTENWLWS